MNAPVAACWRAEDARAIFVTEALEGDDAIFLATHTPIEGFDVLLDTLICLLLFDVHAWLRSRLLDGLLLLHLPSNDPCSLPCRYGTRWF